MKATVFMLSFLLNTTRHQISVRDTTRNPIGQPTWAPYETGGQKRYGALKGKNMGKIWGKCGQDLGPIWATHMRPILHIGNPHGTHMKQVDKNCMGPIWAELWARSVETVCRIWDPYGQPTWEPYEAGGQKPYGPHMGCSYLPHIVVQMRPMWGPCLCSSWIHLKIVI